MVNSHRPQPPKGPATAISLTDPRLPRPSNLPTVPLSYTYGSTTTNQTTNNNNNNNNSSTSSSSSSTSTNNKIHSPSSHDFNKSFGWWEKFIGHGPNYPIDLDWYFVICKNFKLVDHLGISKLFASVGSSMGGMQSIVTAWLKPQRAQRMVSISGCGRTGPSSIALQYAQRHSPEHQSSLSVQLANHSSAVMDSRTSLKPINDSNNVQNQSLRVKARGPLKDNRRSGKLLMEEVDQEHYPGQTVGLNNGCKQSPETDRYGCDSIQQTLLSQEDQKDEDPVK
ncbi:hypothetical protein PPACK8108_LOCUS11674 [Phakopsora pachyrhizi]|uniref:AB hydrolase-1 domain-containing protein n=1 Tax=Phakopsora pachyrhizi TaxID=170000 RepID=A0AAV0B2G2_PHAPC|nr:hypothetical protein PPACK8108_LOCUS11674 [Phakopsora pachyrhizi]